MKKGILVLFSIVLFVGLIVSVSAIPPDPMAFYGSLNYTNGTGVPNGYYIIAKIGNVVSGQCEVINGFYGKGTHACIVVHLATNENSGVEFFLGNNISNKLGEATFQGKEIVRLDFTTDTLPPRNLPPVSNEICEPSKGECSYNILDCDNSLTKVCVGNGVCDAAIGETCTNTPGDCGACPTTSGGGGSSTKGGGGSSSKKPSVITLSKNTTNNTNSDSGDNNLLNGNPETKNSRGLFGITGMAIADFVKTPAGKGVLIFIILVIALGIFSSINRKKKDDLKNRKIKVIKAKDMKAIRADNMKVKRKK